MGKSDWQPCKDLRLNSSPLKTTTPENKEYMTYYMIHTYDTYIQCMGKSEWQPCTDLSPLKTITPEDNTAKRYSQ